MAFGGGGSAVYTAQLQIDTRQATAALSAFGNQLRTSMRNVQQETKRASTGTTIGLEKLTKQLAGPGVGAQQFRVVSAGAKTAKVSFDNLTRAELANLNVKDKMRAAVIGITRAFSEQKKMGQVTSDMLRQMAYELSQVGRAAKTQGGRNQFKQLTDDLVNYANAMDAALNDVGRNKAIVAQADQRVQALKQEADALKLSAAAYRDQFNAMKQWLGGVKGASATVKTKRGGLMGRLGFMDTTKIPGRATGKDPDKIRGQMMPERTKGQAKALLGLSSAAQGAMIGIAALDGNIVGLGFSLIFLSYGIVSVAVAFAALTAALVIAERFFKAIITQGAKAGAAMEKLGTQMSSFFKDQARAQATLTKASGFSQNFGLDPEAAQTVTYELEKMGMATKTYMDAVANAAAATGTDIVAVNEQFLAIQKANAKDQAGLMEQFAKDFDLASTKYTNSLDLAIAINERFAGSAERAGNTQIGMVNKIKATWHDFMTDVGSVLEGFFKPVLAAGLAFVQAMLAGFAAAKKSGEETGDLAKNMADFAATVRMATPYLIRIGWVLGKVVYSGLLLMAKIVKVVADTLIRLWNKIKPIIDTIRSLIPKIKELVDKIISWYKANKDIIDQLIIALGLLFAFEGGMRLAAAAADLFKGALSGLWGMLVSIAKALADTYVFKIAHAGIDAAMAAIRELIALIKSIPSGIANIGTNGFDALVRSLGVIDGMLGSILDKAKQIKLPGISGEPGAAGTPGSGGTPGGLPMPKFVFPADTIARALAAALMLAVENPAVIIAAAAVGAVVAAAVFPKETGIGTKEVVDWTGAILITMLSIVPRMMLRLADALIEMWAFAIAEVGKVAGKFFAGLYDILSDVIKQIFHGLTEIIMGILTLDLPRAFAGVVEILDALFIELPTRLFKLFYDTAKEVITELIPKLAAFFWEQIKYVFEPILELIREPLSRAWEWFKGWVDEFKSGYASRALDTMREAWHKTLSAVWQDFKNIFSFTGSESLYRMITDLWDGIQDLFARMRNPFQQVLDWMDPIIDKAKTVKKFIDAITPGGGGGGNNGGGNGGQQPQQAYWVGARILDTIFSYTSNGSILHGTYQIAKSHWSDQNAQVVYAQVAGLGQPNLADYALGGRVPGRPGTKVPVLADAGEMFLGRPNLARGGGREAAALGGGGGVNIYFDARGSVMTNDVVDELATQIFAKVGRNLSGNRGMTFHRING